MMHRATGRRIDSADHLRQSVTDIITTPIGSRVMRREYGSLVPELLDHPDNDATRVRLNAAVAGALMRWEPRIRLTRITMERNPDVPGRCEITLTGTRDTYRRQASLMLTVPVTTGGGT